MLTRLCPRLSDISVYSGVCVDIKYSQFFVFSSLCNHSHYFQRKGPYKRICDFKADWCWRVVFCQSFTLFLFDQTILFVFIVVWSQSFLRSFKEPDNFVVRGLSSFLRELATFCTRPTIWALLCEESEWIQPDQIDHEKRDNVTDKVYPAWMLIKNEKISTVIALP